MILEGIAVISAVMVGGLFLTWLGTRVRRFKAVPFVLGILLVLWGAYLIYDFLSVVLQT